MPKGGLLLELESFPPPLPEVTTVKKLTDDCRKQHTVTPTQEANNELQGNKTPDRYAALCHYKYI